MIKLRYGDFVSIYSMQIGDSLDCNDIYTYEFSYALHNIR